MYPDAPATVSIDHYQFLTEPKPIRNRVIFYYPMLKNSMIEAIGICDEHSYFLKVNESLNSRVRIERLFYQVDGSNPLTNEQPFGRSKVALNKPKISNPHFQLRAF